MPLAALAILFVVEAAMFYSAEWAILALPVLFVAPAIALIFLGLIRTASSPQFSKIEKENMAMGAPLRAIAIFLLLQVEGDSIDRFKVRNDVHWE